MKKLISAAAVLAALGLSNRAQAAGYQLDTQSGRSTGMVSALTAGDDDASSVLFNPAGLAQIKHFDLEVGDTLIIPKFTFTPAAGGPEQSTKSEVVPPPHVYAGYAVTDNFAIGIGEFSYYGLGFSWPDDFVGRNVVQSINLQTFTFNPSLAVKFGDRVRVGLGVQVVRSTVDLTQKIGFVDSEGQVELAADTWGAGGNAGVQVDILPKMLTLGAAFRSGVDLAFDNGKAHFENVPVEFASTLRDQTGSTSLRLPETLGLGLSLHPVENLMVDLDTVYTAWQRNDAIVLGFEEPDLTKVEPKNWHHGWNYKIGAEYAVSPSVTVRAGFMYDPTPSPEETVGPDLPDSTRINVALGATYRMNDFRVDLGYQLVLFQGVTTTNPVLPGQYKGTAHAISLTLAYGK